MKTAHIILGDDMSPNNPRPFSHQKAHRFALTCLLVVAALSACVEEAPTDSPTPSQEDAGSFQEHVSTLRPASGIHVIATPDKNVVLFTRSPDDLADLSPVKAYLVCDLASHECQETPHNYIEYPLEQTPTQIIVIPVTHDQQMGEASEPALLADLLADRLDTPWPDPDDKADPEQRPKAVCPPPSSLYAPFYGSGVILGPAAATNGTTAAWSMWRHASGFHAPGMGWGGADDTNAYDININVTGAGSNMDRGMEFFAPAAGTIVDWTGNSTVRLIQHNTSGCDWFSGYLHASLLYGRVGDRVSPWTPLGKIGRVGTDNDHLHFVVYKGPRTPLVSTTASFSINSVSISFSGPTRLNLGQSATQTATATRAHRAGYNAPSVNLNSPSVFDNTFWKSSNTGVIRVDGNGRMTAVGRGSATLTLWYSGVRATRTVTVP